jgi:mannose-6-phosphate isomerase-like protein (cupin superfamily)
MPSDELVVSWVEVKPGGQQAYHSHDPEQVYVLVCGSGTMHVGDESDSVERGNIVYIPSNTDHYVHNTGGEPLTYVSAGTPAMDVRPFYEDSF